MAHWSFLEKVDPFLDYSGGFEKERKGNCCHFWASTVGGSRQNPKIKQQCLQKKQQPKLEVKTCWIPNKGNAAARSASLRALGSDRPPRAAPREPAPTPPQSPGGRSAAANVPRARVARSHGRSRVSGFSWLVWFTARLWKPGPCAPWLPYLF